MIRVGYSDRLGSAKSRPERIRISFFDDASGSTPLPLPSRRLWIAGLVIGIFFLIFAGIEWTVIASMHGRKPNDIFDLMAILFQGFWALAWSVGVFFLGALTALFLFYRESARFQDGRLVRLISLGPVRFRADYDLAKMSNVRLETTKARSGEVAKIRFDYGDGYEEMGDAIPRPDAERLVATLEGAVTAAASKGTVPLPARREPPGFEFLKWVEQREARAAAGRAGQAGAPGQVGGVGQAGAPWQPGGVGRVRGAIVDPRTVPADRLEHPAGGHGTETHPSPANLEDSGHGPWWTSASSLALIAANFIPIFGVLFLHWNLAEIMVLFWAESAVIGFYNVLKLVIVGRWSALFYAPFFIGHYGGFMAGHLLFIYYLFVRGLDAKGPEYPPLTTLAQLFGPLTIALVSLFVSHGVSFVTNFLGRREYVGMKTETLMTDPYKRIVIMHLTIIFGGWLVMALKTPVAALVLLVTFKSVADLWAHRRERVRVTGRR